MITWGMISLLSCLFTFSNPYPVLGQLRPLSISDPISSQINLFSPPPQVSNVGNIYAASVRLDGYELFKVTAIDSLKNDTESSLLSASQLAFIRAQLVENELKGIVSNHLYGGRFKQGFQKETLTVTVSQRNGATVIIAYDDDKLRERQIVTVTEQDAQFYGYSVQNWAIRLADIIKMALIRSQLERSFPYFINKLLLSLVIIAVAIALSWVILSWQKKLREKRLALLAEEPINELVLSPSELSSIKEDLSMAAQQSKFFKVREKQQQFSRKLELIRLKRRLFQSAQIIILLVSLISIIELFPWTRWISSEFLQKPFMVLMVVLGNGVIIRLSSIFIDRYTQTLIEEASICPLVCSDAGTSQRRASRLSTIGEISKHFIFWAFTGISLIVSLDILGLPVKALLTGAGVLGIAISLVAQSFIKDLINGIQILRQDRYVVGDFIQVEDTWGLVEGFSLTITQIRGTQGRLTTVPNGDIRVVHNLTKEWARVDIYIKVSHDTDIDLAMKVMQQTAQKMQQDPEWGCLIIEPTVVMGVHNLDHTGVEIQYWMKTKPTQQWSVGREYRRRLKLAFEEKEIHLGIPQQSVVIPNSSPLIEIKDNGVN
ncbi:MscS Mechanosensitive ion channel [Gloeothece citriformis PCC 7424]|uniref:MscS Mechanosensitive ion channel n=2 Tax=Gloeothece TaxID=28070 RepID=B7KI48_GLOC7|nr:MscS Mechanosensitive ion channel [Gloeothece citriformis PCC 7424]